MDFAIYLQFFIGLIALVNPIGVVPIFYSMTSTLSKEQQNRTSFITCISISVILLVSFFFGSFILNAFHISIDSFRIAGGIVVILIALTMINGKIGEHKMNKEEKVKTSMTTIILRSSPLPRQLWQAPGRLVRPLFLARHKIALLTISIPQLRSSCLV